MFEFIHCADIHLGCYPNHNETRFLDFFKAFNNVIDYAIKNNIKLILVSGDFFQLRAINPKTLDQTINILKKAKDNDLDIIAIEGNHDQAYFVDEDSWLLFLQSQNYLKLLKTKIIDGKITLSPYENQGNIIESNEYRIIGLDYFGGSTEKYLLDLHKIIPHSNKFTILMLHAAINRLYGQDMGDVKGEVILQLKNNVDYLALGHIHNRYELYDFAYNPGSLENIRLRDGLRSDDKGFYHVQVENKKIKNIKYINSNPRKTIFLRFDVSNIKNPDEVLKLIKDHHEEISCEDIVEVNLYGQVDFNPYLIDINAIKSYFEEKKVVQIEVNNYVNLLNVKHEANVDDLDMIISELIKDEIKINYPSTPNPEKLSELILNVTKMLTEEVNEDDIIKTLEDEESI